MDTIEVTRKTRETGMGTMINSNEKGTMFRV